MARRDVTDEMRDEARERAHAYLAAQGMSDADLFELARYHVRRAQGSDAARREELPTRTMLANLVVRRLASDGRPYVAPSRSQRGR